YTPSTRARRRLFPDHFPTHGCASAVAFHDQGAAPRDRRAAGRALPNIKDSTMSKTHPLGFRIEREIKEALVKAAKDDHRSVSSLVEMVLAKWLREKGYLVDPRDRAA